MPLAAWRNPRPTAQSLGSRIENALTRASPSAKRSHEPRTRRGRRSLDAIRSPIAELSTPNSRPAPNPRPRPTVAFVAAAAATPGRGDGPLSSASGPLPSLKTTKTKTAETREKGSSNDRVVAVAATGGNDENENKPRGGGGGGLLSRWSQLTAREKSVVVTFVALAILFGPRLLLLSLVSLEAAATGALLAAERALGAAFLTSFVWLAGVAALLLAGLFVYFLILEEERLEDSSSSSDEE